MDGIKGEECVKRRIGRQTTKHVDDLERRIGQPHRGCFGSTEGHRIVGDVKAGKRGIGERRGEQIDAVASTATDVGSPDAAVQQFDEARRLGQVGPHQQGVVFGPTQAVHGVREVRTVPVVGHAPAGPERLDHVIDTPGEAGE